MTFLPLEKKDFYLLALAKEQGYTDEWNENMFLSAINSGNFYGVKVLKDGKVMGYLHYSFAGEDADVNSVFVFLESRKLGAGYKLLETAEKQIILQGAQKIFLEVRENNLPAIKLYEKFGLKSISVRKKYYPDGENAIVMLKEIRL